MRPAGRAASPAQAVRQLRAHARRRPVRRARSAVPALRQAERRPRRRVRHLRQHRRPQAQVRRRRVSGARHDLRRAAQGHDPARRLEQGPRDRRQDHPRHQGAGGLLRRHPADDGQRHVHHQRHRARHRVAAAPLAGRLLPLRRQDALHRADHPVPRLVGGVRVRHQEPALRAHRPQAQVPGDGVPARARPARRRRDHPHVLLGRPPAVQGRDDPVGGQRQPAGAARGQGRDLGSDVLVHAGKKITSNGLAALKKANVECGRGRRRRARRRVCRRRRRRSVDGRGHPRGERRADAARHLDGAGEERRPHGDLLPRARRDRSGAVVDAEEGPDPHARRSAHRDLPPSAAG